MSENKQLFIPGKIKLGYQKREDTFEGKLGYVIYQDKKGTWRKEKSWETWRDKKIRPIEYDNVPTEGFVLNKKVGGFRSEWNFRDAHIRVWDPRGFEFEISVPNLLFLLREISCSRGKGLEGKLLFAWDKTELVLLPVSSDEYKRSSSFTALQGQKVKGKELIPGATYLTNLEKELVFVGRYDHHYVVHVGDTDHYGKDTTKKDDKGVCKKYVFHDPESKSFLYMDAPAKIAALKSDVPHPDLAKLVIKYGRSPFGSKVVKLELKEAPESTKRQRWERHRDPWYFETEPGAYMQCSSAMEYNKDEYSYVNQQAVYELKDGKFIRTSVGNGGTMYPPGKEPRRYSMYNYSTNQHDVDPAPLPWREPTQMRLFATTESGAAHRVEPDTFERQKG